MVYFNNNKPQIHFELKKMPNSQRIVIYLITHNDEALFIHSYISLPDFSPNH